MYIIPLKGIHIVQKCPRPSSLLELKPEQCVIDRWLEYTVHGILLFKFTSLNLFHLIRFWYHITPLSALWRAVIDCSGQIGHCCSDFCFVKRAKDCHEQIYNLNKGITSFRADQTNLNCIVSNPKGRFKISEIKHNFGCMYFLCLFCSLTPHKKKTTTKPKQNKTKNHL